MTSDELLAVEAGDQSASGGSKLAERRIEPAALALAVLVIAIASRGLLGNALNNPWLATWSTILVAVVVQALPFVVLGVLVSGLVATFVTPQVVARLVPQQQYVAVPVVALAGTLLPGCECGSVPIAARLRRSGVPAGAALAFMLSAPAINPVVMVATLVAFPGRPEMALARFAGSLLCAVAVGLLWSRLRDQRMLESAQVRLERTSARWTSFSTAARDDILLAGGWLVVGAAAAATMQTVVPRSVLRFVSGQPIVAVLAMALLAVALSICSEADAFVAASLNEFSLTARLAFLVVGPAVDLKLVAMQAGLFGRRFALRFAPVTFVAAVGSAVLMGSVLL
jgi:uncharacterized membrane protein YraQ (UPF0718 family)